MDTSPTLQAWIEHVFDHDASAKDWYFAEDAREWPEPRGEVPGLVAETFERAGELLARFPDDQLDRGFWYLVGDASPADFMQTLADENIPAATRVRALRSFVPLFEQIMAVRCTPHLSHTNEPGGSPLNSSCFMWWDLLRFNLWHWPLDGRGMRTQSWIDFHSEIIVVLRRLLAINHDACRESALHGIGHLSGDYPERRKQFSDVIDEFLNSSVELRPELVAYAECARLGELL
jgi:hypothetical protein